MIEKVYRVYDSKLFPKIRHLRGATRVKLFLRRLTIDKLDDFEVDPTSIFDKEDWDNLIVLDACRYDKYCELRGYRPDSRVTLGSTSTEYIRRNFVGDYYEDIVYISANAFLVDEKLEELVGKDKFYTKFDTVMEKWNYDKGTVMPDDVVEDAFTAEKLFPKKRKIIHFIQPHYPFINQDFGDKKTGPLSGKTDNALEKAERGEIAREDIVDAYEENLEIVLDHADELAEKLSGKTVITADHGELLGEKGLYAHPDRSSAKKLRKVPWDELD